MTFLYTLIGTTRKQKEKKKFSSLKCIQKWNVIKDKIWVLVLGFMYLVSVDPMDRSLIDIKIKWYRYFNSYLNFITFQNYLGFFPHVLHRCGIQ